MDTHTDIKPRTEVNSPKAVVLGKESRFRSLLKGFTWRILATATTVTIAYIITGHIGDALKIGGIEFFGKLLIYYLHERAWQAVPRGSIRNVFQGK